MDRYAAQRRRERVVAAARWFAVGFLALHVVLAEPPGASGGVDGPTRAAAWLVVGLYALVCVAAEVGIRVTNRREGFDRLGMALLLADVTLASAFVWLYRSDPSSTTWAVLTLLPLEGAVRFGMAGALAAWVGTLPALILPALSPEGAEVALADVVLPPLFLFVLALIGGVVGRDLERQVVVLARVNRAARRIASRRDPEEVLATLCDETVRCLDARSATVVAERDGARRVLWASPWREADETDHLGELVIPLPWATEDEPMWFMVHTGRGTAALAPQVARALVESAAIAIGGARLIAIEQRTNARLRYLEALRKRFVATIAHDLRLPLTVFKGVAHVLRARRDEIEPQEVDDLLASVERQANRLGRLADDLLDAARADAGRITIVREPCRLRAVVEQAAADFAEPVLIDIDPELELQADRGRIDRLVWNLLGNAQKYGHPPYEVRAEAGRELVELSVRDHGPGLPPEVRERLFEEFAAGDSEGVGLGLAIVRQLAEAHGGDVRYSDADPGARFTVTLPRHPDAGAE
ncbi:MAG TPA: HAMP domain-containing sensor histidine kinase [Egibacteraceae bacterium]|nr:HAMP domain-containing sensor histidine kinase [Egibacteraceae bacterium]